ncbi:hypothetical protein [Gilliamella sp. Occ4-3]|uniref:hypothetical protein n=1 Tax=Gilliamella sp. Occ4-3 TaxID=3120254 RepID=UPI00080E5605|nr:hypothetical protein [Gilliamella apicola]OCG77550.1 hypothetical protein A9G44_04415 [Gilliamella apicola]
MILDSCSLFDRKIEKGSDWRIIGHQKNYVPTDMDGVYFTYIEEPWCKKVDIWENEIPISGKEAEFLPRVFPFGDYNIKELLKDI